MEKKTESIKIIIGSIFYILSFFAKSFGLNIYIYYVALAISYVVLGYDVAVDAVKSIVHFELDETFLMFVATIGAIALGDYSEAVFVMLFYAIGEFAQDLAVDKSMESIEKLMDIAPHIARIKTDSGFMEVSPDSIKISDMIKVLPGEIVPLDGKVAEGSCYIDTRAITGESIPLSVSKGDEILSGTIVTDSPVIIEVTKAYEDSTVSRILKLVKENQQAKAPTEKFITKFAKIYTPIVCLLALFLAVIPSVLTGNWGTWIHRSLTFLVISCPCALVLSVPLAFFAGMGCGARNGILFKGGSMLEELSEVDAFAFDKTGTITKAEFKVKSIVCANDTEEKTLLQTFIELESQSNHPAAKAIETYCKENSIFPKENVTVKEIPGKGITGTVNGKQALVGNIKLLKDNGINSDCGDSAETYIYAAYDGKYIGRIELSDTIKSNAKTAIADLKKNGIKQTVILSGDRDSTVKEVSETVKVDSFYSCLLPEDKVDILNKLKKEHRCAYVGDGINDAPCLMASDVGIAMGNEGTASAIEASGVVIMTDDLSQIPRAVSISKHTMRIAKQNIVFSLGIKVGFLVLGALGITGMAWAVFADTGVALLAVLNSLRALRNR